MIRDKDSSHDPRYIRGPRVRLRAAAVKWARRRLPQLERKYGIRASAANALLAEAERRFNVGCARAIEKALGIRRREESEADIAKWDAGEDLPHAFSDGRCDYCGTRWSVRGADRPLPEEELTPMRKLALACLAALLLLQNSARPVFVTIPAKGCVLFLVRLS